MTGCPYTEPSSCAVQLCLSDLGVGKPAARPARSLGGGYAGQTPATAAGPVVAVGAAATPEAVVLVPAAGVEVVVLVAGAGVELGDRLGVADEHEADMIRGSAK